MQSGSESSEKQPVSFKSDTTRKVFDSLVDFFIEDYMAKKYIAEKSGWRTLAEIAVKSHISPSALYGKHSTLGPALDEPVRRGLIEARIFPGERGRGGEVMRLRIAYDKEPIRDFVNKKVMLGRNAIKTKTEEVITATQTLFSPAGIQSSKEIEESGQRKIAVIMFTDIVGYTALGQTDESQALEVLERHNKLLRPFFPKYHGREVKTIGDSFLVEFDSSLDAADCAIEIQEFLHDYNISTHEDWKIKLRIGIHLGDVVRMGDDILGDAVNIASRIHPLADPEGICVSQQVLDQIHNKVSYPLEQLERVELQNVKFQTNVYSIVLPWQERKSLSVEQRSEEQLNRLRVAVLPFSSMSPDSNDEYFADGMTEELISTISKISGLSVIARTSVMSYKKEQQKKIDEIARELKVGTILEGSVRKAGEKLRITAQLISPQDNRHLWSETYNRELKDIFAIQTDIAHTVADALKVRLLSSEEKRIDKKPTKDTQAYTLYLRAFQYVWNVSQVPLYSKAVECLEQALKTDADFALAYSLLALIYIIDTEQILGLNYDERISKAKKLIDKALAIDRDLPEAHLSLASIQWQSSRTRDGWLGEEKEMEQAIELNPSFALGYFGLGCHFLQEAKFDMAVAKFKKAIELDPSSEQTSHSDHWIAASFYHRGKYDEALEHFNSILEVYPEAAYPGVRDHIGRIYIAQGRYAEALVEFQDCLEHANSREKPYNLADLGVLYAQLGRNEEARKIIEELEALSRSSGLKICTFLAWIYTALGEKDKAINLLEAANNQKEEYPFLWVKVDPYLSELHSDRRFIALLKKVGLMSPEEATKAERELETKQKLFDKKRIAILPLVNISPDPNDDYFADGLTEELINVLSQIQELRVIARTSVNHYKETNKPLSQIAQELGVGTLLEGSVRKLGNKIRATLQLVDAQSQEHEWSQNYDRSLDDIFEIQTDIAKHVAESLKVRILAKERPQIEKTDTKNTEAYLAYLRGRGLLHNRGEKELRAAKQQFELAVSLDDKFARAYTGLADVHYLLEVYANEKRDIELIRSLIDKSLELDPNLAEAHISLANMYHGDFKFDLAEKEYVRGIELNSGYALAHHWYALFLEDRGMVNEALDELRIAEEIDPLSTIVLYSEAQLYIWLGRLDEAKGKIEKLAVVERWMHHLALSNYWAAKGDMEQFLSAFRQMKDSLGEKDAFASFLPAGYAYYYIKKGEKERALTEIKKIEALPANQRARALVLASLYATLGDLDLSYGWLVKEFEQRGLEFRFVLLDQDFAQLRNDPRFLDLVAKTDLKIVPR